MPFGLLVKLCICRAAVHASGCNCKWWDDSAWQQQPLPAGHVLADTTARAGAADGLPTPSGCQCTLLEDCCSFTMNDACIKGGLLKCSSQHDLCPMTRCACAAHVVKFHSLKKNRGRRACPRHVPSSSTSNDLLERNHPCCCSVTLPHAAVERQGNFMRSAQHMTSSCRKGSWR